MDIRLYNVLNNLSAASNLQQMKNTGSILKSSNNYGTTGSFYGILREQRINNIKEDIYNKFQISVGSSNGELECFIPSDVLYRMSTNSTLKKKVYDALEDYSGEKFQKSIQGLNPPVKKCTLTFDESGDVTATLEANADQDKSSTYRNQYLDTLLSQSAGLGYYPMLFSNNNSMYGLGSLQNTLFMNMLGSMYSGIGIK